MAEPSTERLVSVPARHCNGEGVYSMGGKILGLKKKPSIGPGGEVI